MTLRFSCVQVVTTWLTAAMTWTRCGMNLMTRAWPKSRSPAFRTPRPTCSSTSKTNVWGVFIPDVAFSLDLKQRLVRSIQWPRGLLRDDGAWPGGLFLSDRGEAKQITTDNGSNSYNPGFQDLCFSCLRKTILLKAKVKGCSLDTFLCVCFRRSSEEAQKERRRVTALQNMMEPSLLQFYVSRQWLNKFRTFAEPGPISNHDFLCAHGGEETWVLYPPPPWLHPNPHHYTNAHSSSVWSEWGLIWVSLNPTFCLLPLRPLFPSSSSFSREAAEERLHTQPAPLLWFYTESEGTENYWTLNLQVSLLHLSFFLFLLSICTLFLPVFLATFFFPVALPSSLLPPFPPD